LTKIHEETVRGPISLVIKSLTSQIGEFTVVVHVTARTEPASRDEDVIDEFGEMTAQPGVTKRKAVGLLARRHGLPPNRVYALIEAAKKSGK
jgi:16S rRNA C1402 (ribose-2'-O) methylase RsmI